jgi:hypothetical protein
MGRSGSREIHRLRHRSPAAARGQDTTHSLTATIPASAPSHICLLAKVWHALDMPLTTMIAGKAVEVADPVHDRHWAQHNLVAAPSAASASVRFLATNPTEKETVCELVIQPIEQVSWSVFSENERANLVFASVRFGLTGARTQPSPSGRTACAIGSSCIEFLC